MTKNFKKVISTVAALAMAASSFVAMAATYPDVAADNKYYSAIEQVSALGIIEGFDDGTFKPDDKVTRAQMAKLVVGAKNLLAEAEGNTRQVFDDVAPGKSEWAMGYVATANDYKIVNGTSDTTFDPDATVTYMQAMKMLVVAAGYEDWAQDQGGWPEGYRYYGNQLKIGAGVTGVSDDTELTRGQVAQMLVNALKAPILDITGYERDNGEKYPIYAQLDGKQNREYQTLLTDAWDVYEVYGRVKGTAQAGNAEVGEVTFQVEKSDNYDGEEYAKTKHEVPGVAVGNTNAEDLYLEYAYALIEVNDDDEATLVYIESAGKNKTVEIDGSLISYEGENSTTSDEMIYVYKSETSTSVTKYDVKEDSDVEGFATATVLINGVEYTGSKNFVELLKEYGETGKITLIDTPAAGTTSTDNVYDYVSIEYYETGLVEEVVADEEEIEIVVGYNAYDDTITVDLTDEDKTYTFVDVNGAEIDPATIAVNSVISVAADVTASDWNNSRFVKAVVSTDKVEGRVSSEYEDGNKVKWYAMNGTDYKMAKVALTAKIKAGDSYTFYLDKDGNIAFYDTLATSVNYAIIDRYFTTAGEDKVRLILKDGSKVDYTIKTDNVKAASKIVSKVDGKDYYETLNDTLLGIDTDPNKDGVEISGSLDDLKARFVKYTVNKNNEVTLDPADKITVTYDGTAATKDTYKAKTNRLGGYNLADTTVILDASQYAAKLTNAVAVTSAANLIDEMAYGVVALGEKNSITGAYPMIVLISGAEGYTVNSKMVVVAEARSLTEDDGIMMDQIMVYDGSEELVALTAEQDIFKDLKEGDAIIYTTDAEGLVDDFKPIYTSAKIAALKDNTKIKAADFGSIFGKIGYVPGTSEQFKGQDGETVDFVVYPVIAKYPASLSVAADADLTKAEDAGNKDLDFAADAIAYEYDDTQRANYKVGQISTSAIKLSRIREGAKVLDSDEQPTGKIDLTYSDNQIAYVVARVVDGDVQEAYSIFFN